jgi:Peptidase family M50.
MDSSLLTGLFVWYAVFLFSTSLHEASHAVVSAWGGDYTAYNSGQATLNPLPHMQRERWGMIIAPLVSYFLFRGDWMLGWASAPFNPHWAARYPKKAFFMSLAGPLSHLIPATFAFVVMLIGMRSGWFILGFLEGSRYLVAPADAGNSMMAAVCMLLHVLFTLNIVLLVFNLLPIPPMDGSEFWYLFIKREEDRLRWRYNVHSYNMAGVLLAWYVFPKVFHFIYTFMIRFLIYLSY